MAGPGAEGSPTHDVEESPIYAHGSQSGGLEAVESPVHEPSPEMPVARDEATADDAAAAAAAAGVDVPAEEQPEENIYEVMKQHMARQKEEQDARNAQMKQQRAYGRPQPVTQAPAAPVVEKVADLTDLPRVWLAARNYLSTHARLLESVLGGCTRIDTFNVTGAEITIAIPNTQKNFTNDKAKGKLEEALRAVTGVMVKMSVNFIEPTAGPGGTHAPHMPGGGPQTGPSAAAQRIPPEIMEKVTKQAVVQQLMKKLDATVTQVEILGTDEAS